MMDLKIDISGVEVSWMARAKCMKCGRFIDFPVSPAWSAGRITEEARKEIPSLGLDCSQHSDPREDPVVVKSPGDIPCGTCDAPAGEPCTFKTNGKRRSRPHILRMNDFQEMARRAREARR